VSTLPAGYQVVITCWVGNEESMVTMNTDFAGPAEALLRQWHRPAWLRKGSGMVADTDENEEVFVHWRDVIEMRIQPMAEVMA
jgi:hypothetical protein